MGFHILGAVCHATIWTDDSYTVRRVPLSPRFRWKFLQYATCPSRHVPDEKLYSMPRISMDTCQNYKFKVCQVQISTRVRCKFQHHTMCEFQHVWDVNFNSTPRVMMDTCVIKSPKLSSLSIRTPVIWKYVLRVKSQYGHLQNKSFYNLSLGTRATETFVPSGTWKYDTYKSKISTMYYVCPYSHV